MDRLSCGMEPWPPRVQPLSGIIRTYSVQNHSSMMNVDSHNAISVPPVGSLRTISFPKRSPNKTHNSANSVAVLFSVSVLRPCLIPVPIPFVSSKSTNNHIRTNCRTWKWSVVSWLNPVSLGSSFAVSKPRFLPMDCKGFYSVSCGSSLKKFCFRSSKT